MLDRPAGTTRTSTTARRDRSQARLAADAGDAAALNGAAVLAILRRRKWLLLASILLCPLLAYVAITQLTPRYTATGTMIYDASEFKVREMQSILRVDPITDAVMATQAEVLRGMPVIEQVANRLNLLTNPEFNTSLRPPSWPEADAGRDRAMLFAPAADPDVTRCRATAGTCPQCHADRGAGRADRHTGEGVARAGGVVHLGRPGHRRRRRRTTRWMST